jgi:hypothetical protein
MKRTIIEAFISLEVIDRLALRGTNAHDHLEVVIGREIFPVNRRDRRYHVFALHRGRKGASTWHVGIDDARHAANVIVHQALEIGWRRPCLPR